jgi:transcription elongation factor Elf1
MPRVKVSKAYTENDKRFTAANKINNSSWKCPEGKSVQATQKGSIVTITCGCDFTESKAIGGIFNELDAFSHFCDEHREKM